eukprot:3219197-Pyramimonas_sp.AAC.1
MTEHDLWGVLMKIERLHKCQVSPPPEMTDPLRWKWTLQLAQGIDYLHRQAGVVHRCANDLRLAPLRTNRSRGGGIYPV